MKVAEGTATRDVLIVLLHALVLWALCGATIGIGRALVGIETTLIVHALAVPVFASSIALFYFTRHGRFSPLVTAAVFTVFVVSLDAGLVAPVFEKSFAMFRSVLGTWIPFGLIFLSTLVTGLVSGKRRDRKERTPCKES